MSDIATYPLLNPSLIQRLTYSFKPLLIWRLVWPEASCIIDSIIIYSCIFTKLADIIHANEL